MDPTIVVLGGTEPEREALVAMLGSSGLAASARSLATAELPTLLVITGADAAHVVAEARDIPALAEVPILAIVPPVPATAVGEALAAGATDVTRTPLSPAVLATRCRNLCKLARRDVAGSLALARINDVLSQHGDEAGALVQMLQITANVLAFERASLVAHIEGSEHAFVIAANDAEPNLQFTLAISDYPEINEAIRTAAPVIIDDALTHPLTKDLSDLLSSRQVRAVAIIPVLWRGRPLGAIMLRKRQPGIAHLGPRGVELARLIASLTAAHLRQGAVLESLRDQTHKISRARYEAERRLRGIDSLKGHFEAGADGVLVLDEAGRILYVNRAAERITGFARDGLVGSELADLVTGDQATQVSDTITRVLAGANVDAFDLQLSTTSNAPVTVSASTSTVLSGTGAVILSFRDVTAERALELELRSTKEFLERLIDSTVDAIIAADLAGTIILFNQGAERLFGYRARDVIGKLPVWKLYDGDGARQIMRMLRSTSYGGVGRLEQTRREVLNANGEGVPVSMTASIVYERETEVATVGILADLRDRIRMEQRLLDAQQKLQLSEKQALVAELAGAAAHELNQPLTSIIGYAQLIERLSEKEAKHLRAVAVILSEAERMAGIVKRIGRITKYETTEYVGSAKMLDLERAAPDARAASNAGIAIATGTGVGTPPEPTPDGADPTEPPADWQTQDRTTDHGAIVGGAADDDDFPEVVVQITADTPEPDFGEGERTKIRFGPDRESEPTLDPAGPQYGPEDNLTGEFSPIPRTGAVGELQPSVGDLRDLDERRGGGGS